MLDKVPLKITGDVDSSKGLFTCRWGTQPAFPNNLSFSFDHVYMIGGVTRHMLPHLSGVSHLPVNRP